MSEEYDLVTYKVPRKDKDGNDITGDKLDKGGRRRKDGTVSTMAYDPVIVNEEKIDKIPSSIVVRRRYEDFPWYQQLIIDVTGIVVSKTADYLTDKATTAFEQWLYRNKEKNRAVKRRKKRL